MSVLVKARPGAAPRLTVLVGAAALVLSAALGVVIGTADLSVATVFRAVAAQLGAETGIDTLTRHIVVDLRAPRVAAAILTGAGLAVCGGVLQSLTGNPLADPYLLGLSSGALLGVSLSLFFGLGAAGVAGFGATSVAAFLGSLAALALVFALASARTGALPTSRLVLAGIAVGQLGSAVASGLVLASDRDAARRITEWTLGSVAGARWNSLAVTASVVAVTLAVVLWYSRDLDSFAFGERAATSLGTDVAGVRRTLYCAVSLCTAVLVAQAGIVGFVGLVVPHIARFLTGAGHLRLLPASALLGALLLVWTDVLCRSALPDRELPLGIVTAVLGVPVFVVLFRRRGGARG